MKRVFGFTKVRYRGLKKNHEWLCAAFAVANVYKNRKRLAKINLRLAPQRAYNPLEATGGLQRVIRTTRHTKMRRFLARADKYQ